MGTMTIRLPNDTHERLKLLADSRGISLNKMFEEFSTKAITEADSYNLFQLHAQKGNKKRGLDTLDNLEKYYGK
ncbi:MAG: toxin-antitoxin system HicB family antitoxin [Alphaproteobacteria bacterium]|nr:MAG: toxin-antitoxin system HicB family antitoxin [Alphaproteobacteria bacterium]